MTVLAVVALGVFVGAMLPRVVATIPNRESVPAQLARRPLRTSAVGARATVMMAATTASAWGVLAAVRGLGVDLPAYLLMAALGAAMAYVDTREQRLPDRLTYSAFAGCAVLLAVAAAASGSWFGYGRAWLAALAFPAAFFLLAMLRPGELGLGDVKLAASLGLLLGWIGWGHVVVGAFAAFVLAGLYGAGLVVAGGRVRGMQIPFGPFMLTGALVAIIWGAAVVDAYAGVVGI